MYSVEINFNFNFNFYFNFDIDFDFDFNFNFNFDFDFYFYFYILPYSKKVSWHTRISGPGSLKTTKLKFVRDTDIYLSFNIKILEIDL